MQRLRDHVFVNDTWYPRGTTRQAMGDDATAVGDHVWDAGEDASVPAASPAQPRPPAAGTDDGQLDDIDAGEPGDEPPLSGPGSSAAAWRAYAETLGLTVPADAKRDDIIEAVRVAGHPVEQ